MFEKTDRFRVAEVVPLKSTLSLLSEGGKKKDLAARGKDYRLSKDGMKLVGSRGRGGGVGVNSKGVDFVLPLSNTRREGGTIKEGRFLWAM